jgi:hypothetical protein
VTQTFAILAKRGVGKNLHSQVLVEGLLGAGARVVIAAPVGLAVLVRAYPEGALSPGQGDAASRLRQVRHGPRWWDRRGLINPPLLT